METFDSSSLAPFSTSLREGEIPSEHLHQHNWWITDKLLRVSNALSVSIVVDFQTYGGQSMPTEEGRKNYSKQEKQSYLGKYGKDKKIRILISTK